MKKNSIKPREEIIGGNLFNFSGTTIFDFNWSNSMERELKLFDCSFDDAMNGLDFYVLCLTQGILADDRSLVFYNNCSNADKSLFGDYGTIYATYPGFDQRFVLNSINSNDKYDEILFFIARPLTSNLNCKSWIDHDLVKDVADEKCFIDCTIRNNFDHQMIIKNIEFDYNKSGAMVLISLIKNNNSWSLNLSHDVYLNGLNEIIEIYHKSSN